MNPSQKKISMCGKMCRKLKGNEIVMKGDLIQISKDAILPALSTVGFPAKDWAGFRSGKYYGIFRPLRTPKARKGKAVIAWIVRPIGNVFPYSWRLHNSQLDAGLDASESACKSEFFKVKIIPIGARK